MVIRSVAVAADRALTFVTLVKVRLPPPCCQDNGDFNLVFLRLKVGKSRLILALGLSLTVNLLYLHQRWLTIKRVDALLMPF